MATYWRRKYVQTNDLQNRIISEPRNLCLGTFIALTFFLNTGRISPAFTYDRNVCLWIPSNSLVSLIVYLPAWFTTGSTDVTMPQY